MKKFFLFAAAIVAAVASAKADVYFGYDAGAEIVSAYIWRGQYNGGLSFQPTLAIGFNGQDDRLAQDHDGEHFSFRIGAWGNVGASDWMFRKGLEETPEGNPNTYFVPEVDIYATLNIYGLTLGATHYYYFGGTPFWSGLEDEGGSQTEVQAGFDFGVLTRAKLFFNWYTMVAGNDVWYNEAGEAQRAYSSYIEVGYNFELPHDITIGVQVGMTPWKSLYTDYEGGFAVNNVQARFCKSWNVGDVCNIELFALGSVNTYGITKENLYIHEAGDFKIGTQQKLNGCIGLGFWF